MAKRQTRRDFVKCAISPFTGFRHAFEGGADFILAGMFDFQIALDVRLANAALAKLDRQRPWRS
jgi:hypothetical protein